MSMLSEYQELELTATRIKTRMMLDLSEDYVFNKIVLAESEKLASLEKAFNSINGLFLNLFGFKKYNTFEEFIKS